ncbi:MAG: gliding motility-associated C-terminal domain-containing protein [Elusimicrobia bacterium]|nr:gliding motility-associated C-terminal domain-containing protein [Elusimicrobiota bacterium]
MNSKKMIMAALAAGLAALLGAAEIRAQDGAFRFFGPLARVITPNGDGVNDRAFFCFDNFSDSGVTGRIYTLLGAEVASTGSKTSSVGTACSGGALPQYVSWDGTANGTHVRSGIYVYRIEAEGKTYSGTLLVVR